MEVLDAVCRCGFERRVVLHVIHPATIACPCGRDAVLLRPTTEPQQGSLFELRESA